MSDRLSEIKEMRRWINVCTVGRSVVDAIDWLVDKCEQYKQQPAMIVRLEHADLAQEVVSLKAEKDCLTAQKASVIRQVEDLCEQIREITASHKRLTQHFEAASAEVTLLRAENRRLTTDTKQCHEQNDRLISEHLQFQRRLSLQAEEQIIVMRRVADLKRANSDLASAAIAPQSAADLMSERNLLRVELRQAADENIRLNEELAKLNGSALASHNRSLLEENERGRRADINLRENLQKLGITSTPVSGGIASVTTELDLPLGATGGMPTAQQPTDRLFELPIDVDWETPGLPPKVKRVKGKKRKSYYKKRPKRRKKAKPKPKRRGPKKRNRKPPPLKPPRGGRRTHLRGQVFQRASGLAETVSLCGFWIEEIWTGKRNLETMEGVTCERCKQAYNKRMVRQAAGLAPLTPPGRHQYSRGIPASAVTDATPV